MIKLHTPINDARANHTTACMQCGKCIITHNAKESIAKAEAKTEINSLYGAEVLSYYFYFSPSKVAKEKNQH